MTGREIIIVGKKYDNEDLYRQTYIYIQKIIPELVMKNQKVYNITYLNKILHLDGLEISIENEKVINIRLFGIHPNCDPDTDNYCLPDFKKGVKFSDKYLNLIYKNVKTYYLDSCYFNPPRKYLHYSDEMNSFKLDTKENI